MKFAKLFERPVFGQVLLKFDVDGQGNPELRWFVRPPELGVCSFAMGFKDSDDGWDAAETAFDAADEEQADAACRALFRAVGTPAVVHKLTGISMVEGSIEIECESIEVSGTLTCKEAESSPRSTPPSEASPGSRTQGNSP
jgi:hypothetical protein